MVATCLSGTVMRLIVLPVSGFATTLSTALTTFAADANDLAVWLSTSTLVAAASTATLASAGHAYLWSNGNAPACRCGWLSRSIDGVHVTDLSSNACHGMVAVSPGKPA